MAQTPLKAPMVCQTPPQETFLEEFKKLFVSPPSSPALGLFAGTASTPLPAVLAQLAGYQSLTVPMKVIKISQPIWGRNSSLYVVFVNFGYDSGYHKLRSCSKRQVETVSAAASARSQQSSWLCPLNVSLIEHSKAEGLRHILCPSFHHS